jgi:hypothetical protein
VRVAGVSTLQPQRDIQDVVFGPYDSRRFGRTLGVNLLGPSSAAQRTSTDSRVRRIDYSHSCTRLLTLSSTTKT